MKTVSSEKGVSTITKVNMVYQRYCGIQMPAKWALQGLKAISFIRLDCQNYMESSFKKEPSKQQTQLQ